MLRVENVWHSYDGKTFSLRGVSLEIDAGELVCIMGPNGAGKTTLARIMGGLIKPLKGRVIVDGFDVSLVPRNKIIEKIGVVFQNPDHQIFSNTVEEEVLLSLRIMNLAKNEIEKRVEDALKKVGIERLRKRSPLTLSGGEKKLVTLASIIAMNPDIMILDEPTAGQDWLNKQAIGKIIKEYVSKGKSVIIVTHDIEFFAEMDARIIILSNGRILVDGEAERVLTNFEILREAHLKPPIVAELISKLFTKDKMERIPIKVEEAASLILRVAGCKIC